MSTKIFVALAKCHQLEDMGTGQSYEKGLYSLRGRVAQDLFTMNALITDQQPWYYIYNLATNYWIASPCSDFSTLEKLFGNKTKGYDSTKINF